MQSTTCPSCLSEDERLFVIRVAFPIKHDLDVGHADIESGVKAVTPKIWFSAPAATEVSVTPTPLIRNFPPSDGCRGSVIPLGSSRSNSGTRPKSPSFTTTRPVSTGAGPGSVNREALEANFGASCGKRQASGMSDFPFRISQIHRTAGHGKRYRSPIDLGRINDSCGHAQGRECANKVLTEFY